MIAAPVHELHTKLYHGQNDNRTKPECSMKPFLLVLLFTDRPNFAFCGRCVVLDFFLHIQQCRSSNLVLLLVPVNVINAKPATYISGPYMRPAHDPVTLLFWELKKIKKIQDSSMPLTCVCCRVLTAAMWWDPWMMSFQFNSRWKGFPQSVSSGSSHQTWSVLENIFARDNKYHLQRLISFRSNLYQLP